MTEGKQSELTCRGFSWIRVLMAEVGVREDWKGTGGQAQSCIFPCLPCGSPQEALPGVRNRMGQLDRGLVVKK